MEGQKCDTEFCFVSTLVLLTQTELFVHTLKDELVRSALLDIHRQYMADSNSSHVHSNGLLCDNTPVNQTSSWQQEAGWQDTEYNEDGWVSFVVFVRS